MSSPGSVKDHTHKTNGTPLSLTSTSILDWIYHIESPTHVPPSSRIDPDIITPCTKRRRDSGSTSSESIGDRPSSPKRGPELLQEMAGTTGGRIALQLGTPISTSSSNPSGGPQTSSNGNISPSKLAASVKLPKTADIIGKSMAGHGLMHEDTAFENYTEFAEKVLGILEGDRSSVMQPESPKRFREYLRVYERMNESTFLHNTFPIIMKDGYHVSQVKEDLTDEEKEVLRKDGKIYRDFLIDEKIVKTMDREFVRTLVPSKYQNQDFELEMMKALAKDRDMKNPKPDYVFGKLESLLLDDASIPPEITALLGIAPGMHHPFFLVEGKADSGSAAEAENQARRGGATIVNAAREVRAMVGAVDDIEGPDYDSFVFSATISPKILEVWVHWYQGPKTKQLFHMNRIASHSLPSRAKDNLVTIRRQLHNIMEWGAHNRTVQHKELYDSIHAYARQKQTEMLDREADKSKKRKYNGSSVSGCIG